MDQLILEMLDSDTVKFGAITLFLLWYVIRSAEKREGWLKAHIEKLEDTLNEQTSVLKLLKMEITAKIANLTEKVEGLAGGRER